MKYEPAEQRFWRYVDKQGQNGCWNWLGAKERQYGLFNDGAKMVRAHRFAYELLVGPIPIGMTIDHLCLNRSCVNPQHMEIVSNKTNVLRGIGRTAANARKTHCLRGHPFDEYNTYVQPNGQRKCRTCRRAFDRKRRTARLLEEKP